MMNFRNGVAALVAGLGMLALAGTAAAAGKTVYEVTITNLTRGQVFTPPILVSHASGVRLFVPGQPASDELESLAEAGDVSPLANALGGMPGVLDIATSLDPVPPGGAVTLRVSTQGHFRHLSLAGMLVPTNDGFVALNGIAGPRGNKTMTLRAPAYDAGTEPNSEACADIPGPPGVCGGEGADLSEDGEGYVHIHAGIHGIADLSPGARDWRNPVAEIRISRVLP